MQRILNNLKYFAKKYPLAFAGIMLTVWIMIFWLIRPRETITQEERDLNYINSRFEVGTPQNEFWRQELEAGTFQTYEQYSGFDDPPSVWEFLDIYGLILQLPVKGQFYQIYTLDRYNVIVEYTNDIGYSQAEWYLKTYAVPADYHRVDLRQVSKLTKL